MEMYSSLYIRKLVARLCGNMNSGDDKVIFIKHYNTLDVSREDIQSCIEDDFNATVLYYDYGFRNMQQSYEPFLEWMKELYFNYYQQKMSIETFLEKSNVYTLHREILQSYMETGDCKRHEKIIVPEVEYEKMKFIGSFISILEYVSKEHPLFIVLNKLHLSNYAVLSLLVEFIKQRNNQNHIALLATYNEVFAVNTYMQNIWSQLLNTIETQNMLFDWGIWDKQKTKDMQDNFLPRMEAIEEYIVILNNMLHTLSLEQADYYFQIIYQRIEREKLSVTLVQKKKIFYMYAKVSLLNGNIDNSLLLSENLISWCDPEVDLEEYFEYIYLLGVAQIYMSQFTLGEMYAKECKSIAERLQDDFLAFRANLLKYMCLFRGWKDIFLCDFNFLVDEKLVTDLEKYDYKNHLAYVYVYGFENDISMLPKMINGSDNLTYLPKAVKIGKELGNVNFLVAAYKKCVTVFEGYGLHELVGQYYKQCLELLKIENNRLEEGNIYNGLGYSNAVNEKFVQSSDNFNEALKIMYEEKIPENVAEILYNLSINCLMAANYNKAFEFLVLAEKMVDILGLRLLRVCNMSKVYGLMALASYYMNVEYNCYLYLNKMERIVYHLVYPDQEEVVYDFWDDDLFLYYFVKALLYKHDDFYEDAQKALDRSYFHLNRSHAFKFLSFPFWTLEQARLYKILGEQEKAKKILEKGMNYCQKKGYEFKLSMLRMELEGKSELPKQSGLTLKYVTDKQVIDLAKQCNMEKELADKAKDINFLSVWQDMLNREDYTVDMLISNSMSMLQNTFTLDTIFYIKMINDEPELAYATKRSGLLGMDLLKVVKFFQEKPYAFLVNRTEKSFNDYKELTTIFGINNLVTIVGIPHMANDKIEAILFGYIFMHRNFTTHKILPGEEQLTILKFSFSQFLDAIERLRTRVEMERMNKELKEVNRKLQEIAITDVLTGLLNRQGFKNRIEEDKAYLHNVENCVLLYIDLDNFKYYNDTFGHDIGDFILVLFSDLFKDIVKNNGMAVRYGGDEFIVMFPEKDEEYGIEIAEHIYEKIGNGFINEIEGKLGRKIDIPEEKKVSCSIGIAEAKQYNAENIYKAISQADEALYYIKRKSKRDYMVWEKIPKKGR